jgi:hypothetical protein
MPQSEYILKLEAYRQYPDNDKDVDMVKTELEFIALRKIKGFTDEQKFIIIRYFLGKNYFLFLEKAIESCIVEDFIKAS